jgi:L,D-transpeptidase YbiS
VSFEDLIPRSRGAVEPEGTAVVFAVPRPRRWIWILALAGIVMAALVFFAMGTGYRYGEVSRGQAALDTAQEPEPSNPAARKKALSKLRAQEKRLAADLQKKEPKGIYVVVDQTQNRIYLKQDEQTLLEARCSAGSGMVLKEAAGGKGRQWVFDTPRGLFKVKNRQADPVWKKPDWAFVEEGKPIPKNEQERFDYGTLGEYAFYLGDGYMIHGTLYERLLGRSVTHGCIRVGKDDLRVLWKYVQVGTPVYIY